MDDYIPFNPQYLADALWGRLPGNAVPEVDSVSDSAPAPVSPEVPTEAPPAEAGVPVAASEDDATPSPPPTAPPPSPAPKAPQGGLPDLSPRADSRADSLFKG
jgi:hypothetical protein